METSEIRSLGQVAPITGADRGIGLTGLVEIPRESRNRLLSFNVNGIAAGMTVFLASRDADYTVAQT